MHLLFNILITSTMIYFFDKVTPAVHIKNFSTAIGVAIVYSLLNFLLGWLFKILTFPLMLLTFGLFAFIINAFLLWLTDKLIDGFKIDGFGWTLLISLLISIGITLTHKIFGV